MGCPDCHGGQNFVGCTEPDGGVMVECGPCPPTCSAFDETSCKANSGCTPIYCPMCTGGQSFVTCFGPGDRGQLSCPAPCPAFCIGMDQTSCAANSQYCRPITCPDCNGGQRFIGCDVPSNVGGPACPACPAPGPCTSVTTLAECDAKTNCHSVFFNSPACSCGGTGCCTVFFHCADGAKATCTGTPTCQIAMRPYCEAPAYVISYTASCYEGCVRPTECAP
jgi:hypothetical protein